MTLMRWACAAPPLSMQCYCIFCIFSCQIHHWPSPPTMQVTCGSLIAKVAISKIAWEMWEVLRCKITLLYNTFSSGSSDWRLAALYIYIQSVIGSMGNVRHMPWWSPTMDSNIWLPSACTPHVACAAMHATSGRPSDWDGLRFFHFSHSFV